MLRINSKLLLKVLTDIRRALSLKKRGADPVCIRADKESLTVGVSTSEARVTCQLPIGGNCLHADVPMDAFADLHGSARQDVSLNRNGDEVVMEFRDSAGIPVSTIFRSQTATQPTETVGTEPVWLLSNNSHLGTVLYQAASISAPESLRYSLGCIRLRGSDGQVAATDGRQAFVSSGFAFPVDEILIPGDVLSNFPSLVKCTSISVGRSIEWLSIRLAVGMQRWVIDLRISDKGRFPNVDQCFPIVNSSRTEVRISERDAHYLMQHLKSLLGTSVELNPVTLDLAIDRMLNKRLVQLRFRKRDFAVSPDLTEPMIEVTLDGSRFEGLPMRVAFDAHFLLTALTIGFRTFHMQSPCLSVFSIEGRNKHVLAAMHESLTVFPVSNMEVISTAKSLAAA